MLPKKQLQKQKKVYAAVTELCKLNKISWNAPLIPLAKLIQTGWVKGFTLRDDCSRRSDAQVYRTICKQIQAPVFCRKKNFIDKKGKEIKPGFRIIGKGEWDNLGWPEHYKKYFAYDIWSIGRSHTKEGWGFWRGYYFIEEIKPYFITHQRTKIPEVETRIAELEGFINNNNGWKIFEHYKRGHYWDRRERDRKIHKYLNEFDADLIEIIGED